MTDILSAFMTVLWRRLLPVGLTRSPPGLRGDMEGRLGEVSARPAFVQLQAGAGEMGLPQPRTGHSGVDSGGDVLDPPE